MPKPKQIFDPWTCSVSCFFLWLTGTGPAPLAPVYWLCKHQRCTLQSLRPETGTLLQKHNPLSVYHKHSPCSIITILCTPPHIIGYFYFMPWCFSILIWSIQPWNDRRWEEQNSHAAVSRHTHHLFCYIHFKSKLFLSLNANSNAEFINQPHFTTLLTKRDFALSLQTRCHKCGCVCSTSITVAVSLNQTQILSSAVATVTNRNLSSANSSGMGLSKQSLAKQAANANQ